MRAGRLRMVGARKPIRALIAARAERSRFRRCIVAGNGPSLDDLDLGDLEGTDLLTVNDCFRWAAGLAEPPIAHVVQDEHALLRFGDQLRQSPWLTIVRYESAVRWPGKATEVFEYCPGPLVRDDGPAPVRHPASYRWLGLQHTYTVVASAVQLAVLAGYTEVGLVGCDNSYARPPEGQVLGRSPEGVLTIRIGAGDDQNHVAGGGWSEGSTVYFAPLDLHERSYAFAATLAASRGARVVNCSTRGSIDALPSEPLSRFLS